MLKKLTTFWRFLLPVMLALLVAIAFLSQQQNKQAIEEIHIQAEHKALSLSYLFTASYKLVSSHTASAMKLLKQKAQVTTLPYTLNTTIIGQETLPNLYLNDTAQTDQTALVDEVSSLMEVKTSVFVKRDQDFIRIATNIKMPNGLRAIGTKLDAHSKPTKP